MGRLGLAWHYDIDEFRPVESTPIVIDGVMYVTGAWSMFAKIVCRDTIHLRQILNEKIQEIQGIQRTETFISLEESIKRQITLV